jgi:hypothetical protein
MCEYGDDVVDLSDDGREQENDDGNPPSSK